MHVLFNDLIWEILVLHFVITHYNEEEEQLKQHFENEMLDVLRNFPLRIRYVCFHELYTYVLMSINVFVSFLTQKKEDISPNNTQDGIDKCR